MASILEEKEAIRDVLSAYCWYMDHGEFDRWATLFVEDAIFDAGPRGQIQGRAAIKEFVVRYLSQEVPPPTRRHYTVNSLITVHGAEATAESYFLAVRTSDKGVLISSAGRYRDQLVKQGETWRLKVRKLHFDMVGS
jgi:3-phenylpropionate/cinnamic acid dioxygenase small subunit